jgi:regulator of protease activity HflC (stomatin/prohibitin superfamily)
VERGAVRLPGFLALLIVLVVVGVAAALLVLAGDNPVGVLGGVLVIVLAALLASGLTIVNPNQAIVVRFFGRYVGSVRTQGFHCVLPLTARNTVSLRVRNFETDRLKVNDAEGNPVEIAAVVVWRVTDAAEAVFGVDDFVDYVAIQSETAVRALATAYAYDSYDDGATLPVAVPAGGPVEEVHSLRNSARVAEELTVEIGERVARAGVEVLESRLTHLAYAPEIAGAMLQRQQAGAVVAARTRIVNGAVGMVRMALDQLAEQDVVDLDEERKAAMVSNLLVVLCGDRATQPVVNTGTLYT